ncbi:uncharacterized protein LOC113510509 [Galleria mellonella]|uniref:Uncharacterized protein LOC113510509 n=1 Tax=Galleria mellonella TaxID=7137 RepID=A0A6J3C7T0_GALME|nr:uncharacterized protein LOC113510509 [Galleria mellonella]
MCARQLVVLLCTLGILLASASPLPDSAGSPPLPGPGLSYGGIPYGSMSGNVAEYFKRQAPSVGRARNLADSSATDIDFAPIEQWL